MDALTRIYLIRHGDIAYPTDSLGRKLLYGPDEPLTEVGKKQIHALAAALREGNVSFNKIYTSPLVRARQTAKIIADNLGVTSLIEREELTDIHGPHHVGMLWEDVIRGDMPRFDDHETHEQVAERMRRIFFEIHRLNIGGSIGIVSHGDPIRVLLYRLHEGEGPPPDIGKLNEYDYLNKGEAWKFTLNDRQVVRTEFITTREGRSLKRERED